MASLGLLVIFGLVGQGLCAPQAPMGPRVEEQDREFERIVGGVEATPNEFPFMVNVGDYYQGQFCGGSILNAYYVLTAAHCYPQGFYEGIEVVVGDHDKWKVENSDQVIAVTQVISHPAYNKDTSANDVALLRLASPIDLSVSSAAPIQLSPGSACDTGTFTVSGWGAVAFQGPKSNVLRKVNVDLVDLQTCSQQYGRTFPDSMICAMSSGKDSCQNDSGGPLFKKCNNVFTQVGVVSFGDGCAKPTHAGVYQRVSKFVNWINANMDLTPPATTTTQAPSTDDYDNYFYY